MITAARVALLDPHTVNQIAAGEVVERPASVVKELLENALDAGARRIEVELEGGGVRLVRVRDDGEGMSRADAELALHRHATSKIRSAADLARVRTLGFRGEALPSIASVSRFSLSTGLGDGLRWRLVKEGAGPVGVEATSGPRGTEVSVEDLFWNVPARAKFLKGPARELAACVEVVGKAAVARPDVAFSLRHGSSKLLATSGSGEAREAIAGVWGREAARALFEIEAAREGARVRGFVSPPHFTKPTRARQWFFVNGRPVRSRLLSASLDHAYRSLTPENRHPLAVLLVEVDPDLVDQNVSPTKAEVKFWHEGAIFDLVRRAIRDALLGQGMVPEATALLRVNEALARIRSGPLVAPLLEPEEGPPSPLGDEGRPVAGAGEPEGVFSVGGAEALSELPTASAPRAGEAPGEEPPTENARRFDRMRAGLRVVGQVMGTFIVAENEEGLLLIDQHVAHERILYERIRDARRGAEAERQALLSPELLELGAAAAAALGERLDELREAGFEVEPFGAGSFLVRAVPAMLRDREALAILRDLAEELAESPGPRERSVLDELWIMAACKLAIKAGDPLGRAEMEKLVFDLARTENPYLCPHGRPITIVLPKRDLLRKFKRS